ncbi:MAG: adenylate/guanylate cyclase domain-containing protein [Nannocystis sp.]|nr:adenylate/guanylate cyclase domain-containing protein [Nannocystis sp.]
MTDSPTPDLPVIVHMERALYDLAARLSTAPDQPTLRRLCEHLHGLDPYDRDRIAPYQLAERLGLTRRLAVDLCVIAARAGLLEISYQVFCLGCGAAEYDYGVLDQVVSGAYFCTVCRRERPADLDDRVEVIFRLSAALGHVRPDPYVDLQAYRRRYFSPHLHFSEPVASALAAGLRGFLALAPGERATVRLELLEGRSLQVLALDAHLVAQIEADHRGDGPREAALHLSAVGIDPPHQHAAPGQLTLHLENQRDRKIGVILRCVDWERVAALYREHPPTVDPYLSARDLLTHQRFVELFGASASLPELRLQIQRLTLLFTDLRGSTRFYLDRGDFDAYYVVREHFALLQGIVRARGGAVVKTMGDAVMAVFADPRDAVAAALDMQEAWSPWSASGLPGLKAGVHHGPALVVNSDGRYDYFGQSVNHAAALQALADGGDIYLSEPVLEASRVREEIDARRHNIEPRELALKGQQAPSLVYRVHQRGGPPAS